MNDDHHVIDLRVTVDCSVGEAWALVGEPGWFINDGALMPHTITWHDDDRVEVTDPDHGSFTFVVERHEPPHHLACRGLDVDGRGSTRLVELSVSEHDGRVSIRVVESGFASMAVSAAERVAQYEQNVETWRRQLTLARSRLTPSG